MEDLLDVSVEKVHTDRLYAGLDPLPAHQEAIEKHLQERLGDLFDLQYDLLLYDITSTYFEGQCAAHRWRNAVIRGTAARRVRRCASDWW